VWAWILGKAHMPDFFAYLVKAQAVMILPNNHPDLQKALALPEPAFC
jgi:hypothetical protein